MGSSSSPPTAPNPYVTAQAQTGENVETAIANDVMSRINQTDPYGDTINYSMNGMYFMPDPSLGGGGTGYFVGGGPSGAPTGPGPAQRTDPNAALEAAWEGSKAGGGYVSPLTASGQNGYWLPIYSETTTLSPQNQAIYNTVQQTEGTLANTANQLASAAQTSLATPLDLTKYQVGPAPTVQPFNPANYNGAYSAWEQPFNQAWTLQGNNFNQMLADQGIAPGSEAYKNAQFGFTQNKQNALDVYNNSMLGAEQNAYNLSNAAALNAYEAAIQGAGYNANLALQQQQLPLNELNMLLRGNANGGALTSIANPNFIQIPNSQIPTTNLSQNVQSSFQDQLANYQQQQANQSALYGGLFGLGGSLLAGGTGSGSALGSIGSALGGLLG